jgi:hypothetical protein
LLADISIELVNYECWYFRAGAHTEQLNEFATYQTWAEDFFGF